MKKRYLIIPYIVMLGGYIAYVIILSVSTVSTFSLEKLYIFLGILCVGLLVSGICGDRLRRVEEGEVKQAQANKKHRMVSGAYLGMWLIACLVMYYLKINTRLFADIIIDIRLFADIIMSAVVFGHAVSPIYSPAITTEKEVEKKLTVPKIAALSSTIIYLVLYMTSRYITGVAFTIQIIVWIVFLVTSLVLLFYITYYRKKCSKERVAQE